jgi:hypothetical protein
LNEDILGGLTSEDGRENLSQIAGPALARLIGHITAAYLHNIFVFDAYFDSKIRLYCSGCENASNESNPLFGLL